MLIVAAFLVDKGTVPYVNGIANRLGSTFSYFPSDVLFHIVFQSEMSEIRQSRGGSVMDDEENLAVLRRWVQLRIQQPACYSDWADQGLPLPFGSADSCGYDVAMMVHKMDFHLAWSLTNHLPSARVIWGDLGFLNSSKLHLPASFVVGFVLCFLQPAV